jgi:hypothetical protein
MSQRTTHNMRWHAKAAQKMGYLGIWPMAKHESCLIIYIWTSHRTVGT